MSLFRNVEGPDFSFPFMLHLGSRRWSPTQTDLGWAPAESFGTLILGAEGGDGLLGLPEVAALMSGNDHKARPDAVANARIGG
jgi:hypothetical protein